MSWANIAIFLVEKEDRLGGVAKFDAEQLFRELRNRQQVPPAHNSIAWGAEPQVNEKPNRLCRSQIHNDKLSRECASFRALFRVI
jgi:hypothetical protein